MKVYVVASIRERFRTMSQRANEPLGSLDAATLGIGRYVAGSSPWEKHSNGDELLFVVDGRISVELLDDDGASESFEIGDGHLFVVPKGKWHRLTATGDVNILFASPPEDGAERTRERPLG